MRRVFCYNEEVFMNLNTPVSLLNHIGKTLNSRLKKLGIVKVIDLLNYFPFRYEDYRGQVKINELKEGMAVSVKAKVELIANRRSFKSRKIITEAMVSDETGSVRIIWFNQPYIIKNIRVGEIILFSGTVKADMLGAQLISPLYEKNVSQFTAAHLIPVYSLVRGLTNKQLRFIMKQAIGLIEEIPDWLSADILDEHDLYSLSDAVKGIHFPVDEIDLNNSLKRLKFNELFLLQLKTELARRAREKISAPIIDFKEKYIKEFVSSLPFSLTKSQKLATWEILQDLNKNIPMNRLFSGDVGSGKTVVAALAIYSAVLNNYQAVLLAPTEILARQHFETISRLFIKYNIKIALFSRSQYEISAHHENIVSKNLKKQIVQELKNGQITVAIGTHALLSEKINFKNLALAIVDEQHRFGVEQRKMIKQKGMGAHFLSMTATPIPRSLALTVYGDLDLSIIEEMPVGRKPIMTRLVESHNRAKAYDFIREQIKKGRQAFVVCPLIENENDDKKSVLKEYEKLSKEIFPDLAVAFLHGRMKGEEKGKIMADFKNGIIKILISTSVVEVGVDIPNASVMMIEGSEGFGLAQLHQFRGRVGRSVHQSYCFLFVSPEVAVVPERLYFFEKNLNGFKLAEHDLQNRGPGEVYGTTQSGMMNLKLAKLTDHALIKLARGSAVKVADNFIKYPLIKRKVENFAQNVHLE